MEGFSVSEVRANKFLNNKSTLLKMLPPTEGSFVPHLKWAMYVHNYDQQGRSHPKAKLATPDQVWMGADKWRLHPSFKSDLVMARATFKIYLLQLFERM